MSWIERMLEQRLAAAARNGELDGGPLTGKPLPDLDRQRPDGWWAERFAARELSHDRRIAAIAEVQRARAGFWSAGSAAELERRVVAANRDITAANVNLVDADRIEPFDVADAVRRWAALRGAPGRLSDPPQV